MAIKTIGNPLSWGMRHVGEAAQGVAYAASHAGGEAGTEPVLRKVTWEDIRIALRLGIADFTAMRSDVIMACILTIGILGVLTDVLFRIAQRLLFPWSIERR